MTPFFDEYAVVVDIGFKTQVSLNASINLHEKKKKKNSKFSPTTSEFQKNLRRVADTRKLFVTLFYACKTKTCYMSFSRDEIDSCKFFYLNPFIKI